MKTVVKLAIAVIVTVMAMLQTEAQNPLTYQQAVQLVKAQRPDSVNSIANYYATTVTSIINDDRCYIDSLPEEEWATNGGEMILVYSDDQPWKDSNYECNYYYLPKYNLKKVVPILGFRGNHFPGEMDLERIDIKVTPGCRAVPSPFINTNNSNWPHSPELNEGTNTMVVIAADYREIEERNTRRWNTCSTLYKLLTLKFGIPKDNIRIYINDAVDGSRRGMMFDCDSNLVFVPRDYDGDGFDEPVFYSMDSIFNELVESSRMLPIDHLFIYNYFGGECKNSLKYKLLGLDYEVTEEYLRQIDSNILNIMTDDFDVDTIYDNDLGDYVTTQYWRYQVITGLERIIGSDDYNPTAAFNPFMFAWMGALNEADLISGDSISSDLNNNGSVSMSEAYQYARNYWDDEPNGMCSRLSASEENLPSLLSFDIVPHPAKLLIRRFEADTLGNLGTEPVVTWNSPDIWMRNNSDGVANPEQDNIRVSNGDNSKYIYVRIKNTGGLPYSAGNKYLHVLVEQCNLTSSRNSFIWPATDIHENLQPIRLSQTIAPDSAIIVEIPVPLTTAMYDLAGEYNGMLPLNVYAKIDRLQNEELESYMPMSKKSLTRFTPIMGEYLHLPSTNQLFQKYVFRTQLPIYLEDLTGSLCWSAEDLTGSRMLVYGDSYIQFSENMDSVGLQLQQMVNQGDNMFCLTALPASLYDVSQYYGDNMVFRYDYSGRMPINDTSETHHIMIRDQQGNVLDGTSIQLDFIGQPSPGEEPIIQMAENNDGSAQLEALNTHSGSSHEWYSDGGELKGESQSISLTQNELHGNMLLRVVDQETSSVQLASINLDKANQISSVQYLDGQGFDITLFRPSSSDAVICVTSLLTAEIVARSEISQGTSSIMLPSTSISAGLYAVTLIVDNAIADTVQLVIK